MRNRRIRIIIIIIMLGVVDYYYGASESSVDVGTVKQVITGIQSSRVGHDYHHHWVGTCSPVESVRD